MYDDGDDEYDDVDWIGPIQGYPYPIPIRQTILTVMTQMRQKCKWQNEDTRHYYDEENVG